LENNDRCLEKYYRHAVNTAVKSLKLYDNDPVLRFFKAFATLMEEFIQLRDHPHLCLCSTAALIYAHKRSEAIGKYCTSTDWRMRHWFSDIFCVLLHGWIVLTSDTEENRPQAIRYFDSGVQDAGNLFGLMGKMEFFMAKQNEQCALDIANQIIVSHPDFSPALLMKMKVFVSLRDWEQTEAVAQRCVLLSAYHLKGSYDAFFKDHYLCGHNPEILQMLTVFVRRVSSRTPVASDVICELGYLLDHQSKYKDAHKCYSTALKTDNNIITVQKHYFHLNIKRKKIIIIKNSEVPLLKALLGRKQGAGEETVMHLLKDATERHFSALRGLNYGVEYLQMLDLNFLLQIVCMHLESKQDFALVPGQTPPFWLKHSNMILETVIKAVPGINSIILQPYHNASAGEHRTAQHFLNLCIEKDPSVPEVHLLQARLHLSAGEHSRCLSCLESLMSVIYQVRDRFQFHLLKARALLRSGDLKNAIQCLKITMSMPGVRRPSEGPQFFISPSERVSVYLELTEALRLNGEQHEATRVLQDALLRFKGTPEETRLMLANVDLALARDDVDAAVVMLQNILPTESTYIQAREKMAHIYLERKHNEKLYITCYREISEQLPGAHTRILLADAFMKIHQPEEAVKIYREVEKIAPKYTLAKKIGQALVKAHEYETAVSYYETALKTDTLDCLMSVELSELLLKLKRFEKAQQVLEKLHDLQQKVVFRAANEHPEELEDQRKSLVVICCDWAREFHLRRNLVKAKQHYTDALNHSPDNEEVNNFHAMAKFLHILRRMGKLDDVRSVFIACEKFSPLSVREAGYSYCKGLYFWSVSIRQYHHLYYNGCSCKFVARNKVDRDILFLCLSVNCSVCLQVMLEASLLMMAQGFVQLKQIPRARNVLKRLSRMEWSDTNADDLESACLLLADMYIKTRKYTQVDKLLDSCIRHNQSCSKAYEYRGLIMESEQRHSDAALQYELAWKHSSRAHPAVGFRLAFNYLKCKNYTLAVDVCHQVLQQCPDYPEIQDELLTRAQLSLRL
uniref:Tetratricopeptide repeat domain 21A n=1 Tax=Sinocyclocheilus grahami TaxID=75366 RepID=A0A672MDJ2_SINGR